MLLRPRHLQTSEQVWSGDGVGQQPHQRRAVAPEQETQIVWGPWGEQGELDGGS